MGVKGSWQRRFNQKNFDEGWELAFGKKAKGEECDEIQQTEQEDDKDEDRE